MAAAMGSSMSRAQRAPALSAASRTARFSTSVTPEGMPSSIRGRGMSPTRSWTRCTKYLIICSVTSKSLMTPSRSGRTAMMLAGVRPTMRLASAPTSSTLRVPGIDGDHAGLADDDAPATHVDEGVGSAEVDPDIAGEPSKEGVKHGWGGPLRGELVVRTGGHPSPGVRPVRGPRTLGSRATWSRRLGVYRRRAWRPFGGHTADTQDRGGGPGAAPACPVCTSCAL